MYDICIIGSGQSGLTTCKTFIEKKYNVIVLEKSNYNGIFTEIKEKDKFYWSTSRYMSGFSDFPMSKDIPAWFTIQQYIDYLNNYKKKFGLDKYIKYNSNVIECKQNINEEWIITYINNNKIYKLFTKKLIVCTGLNQTPKFPDIINNYTGKIIHTDTIYRNMNEKDWENTFSNKKILLLGGGESAFDIGHIITKYTNKLYYSSKDYVEWFMPGNEFDENLIRARKINNICLSESHLKIFKYPTDVHLNYSEYSLPDIMSNIWHNYGRLYARNKDICGICSHGNKKLCDINKTPNNLFKKYVVKRTDFLLDIFNDKVNVVYYPDKIYDKKVYTKEYIIEDVDIIICATGFRKYFPFLDKNIYESQFIKKMIPINYKNIAFIGFVRPTMGSIATLAEMQSWWIELYFSNNLKYHIRKSYFRNIDVLNLSNEHINSLVVGCYYIKDLAKDMNIEPNMLYLFFTDYKLFTTIYTGSCHPMIYRINGQKYHKDAKNILLNTFPDFDDHSNYSKIYILSFTLYHYIFIIVTIIIFILFFYFLHKLIKLKYKKLNFLQIYPYIIILSILFIIYIYVIK